MPKIIQKIKNINDDKDNHQSNLFDDQENNGQTLNFCHQIMGTKRILSEEFKSIGFYLTNHPLNEFEEIFSQLNISTYNHFYDCEKNEV